MIPNLADCETFFLCNNGAQFLITCAEGEKFDKTTNACADAAQATCA
jgi:hypothetical protein